MAVSFNTSIEDELSMTLVVTREMPPNLYAIESARARSVGRGARQRRRRRTYIETHRNLQKLSAGSPQANPFCS